MSAGRCSGALLVLWVGLLGACHKDKDADAAQPEPEPTPSWGPKVAAGETSAEEAPYQPTFYAPAGGDGKLHVYFFDVGRGDAALIVSPTGRTVLVDGGPREAGRHLVHRLPELLHESIDLVVLSHAHEDHYGGLAAVVSSLGAKRFLDPQLTVSDAAYQKLMDALRARKVDLFGPTPDAKAPDAPVRISLGGGATLSLYWPRTPTEPLLDEPDALEKNSLVMRLTYVHTSFLFTGDARAETEQALLSRRIPLHATVLKVASHGLDVANTQSFLEFVTPKAAFVTPGPRGNAADRAAVLARLARGEAQVFAADVVGEMDAVSDGSTVTVTTERPNGDEARGTPHVFKDDWVDDEEPDSTPAAKKGFVANKSGKVFHRADCPSVEAMAPDQRLTFSTRKAALKHRRPAEDCKP